MLSHYSSLIPIGVLLASYIGFKRTLVLSATFALLSTLVLQPALWSTLYFNPSPTWYSETIQKTLLLLLKIGSILAGAFYFLEVAKKTNLLQSITQTIQSRVPNFAAQVMIISFAFTTLVEGSSGFGTPLLVVAPILRTLGLPIHLCVLLPLINCTPAIPFGALGIPLLVGFSPTDPSSLAATVILKMIPLSLLAPLITWYFIKREARTVHSFKEITLGLLLSLVFIGASLLAAKQGAEFPGALGGFTALMAGLIYSKFLFGNEKSHSKNFGLTVYVFLILLFFIGRKLELFWLSPGPVFIYVGTALLALFHRAELNRSIVISTFNRGKRTLWVFACLTFYVQWVKNNGALNSTAGVIPFFFKEHFSSILGFLGTLTAGTSTVSNLLLSGVVDSSHYTAVAMGSAIGVQLTFQGLTAATALFDHSITEKQLFKSIAPFSILFVLISLLVHIIP